MQTSRGPVEAKPRQSAGETSKFPKTHVNFWRGKLRRQRYGSKTAGTYRELPSFYVRISHQGKQHAFTFQTLNETAAATQARDIYLSLLQGGWEGVLSKNRPEKELLVVDPTVGQFLSEVEAKAGLRTRTFRNYANCFRTIVSELSKINEGGSRFDYRTGGAEAWRSQVDAVKLSAITPAAVQAWKVARLKAAGSSPTGIRSAKRTINSYLRCSRSLFNKKTRKYLSLAIPEPAPFDDVEMEQAGSMRYSSQIDVVKLVAEANGELREAAPEAYKILILALFAGLRRNEIDGLEWSALDWTNGVIHVQNTDVMRLKSDESEGVVAMEPEVMAALRSLQGKNPSRFVVEAAGEPRPNSPLPFYRCKKHFAQLISWLRTKGVTANKPLHELRKELGALIASKHGIYAASRILRHSDISTTARHYADQKGRITAGLGGLLNKVGGA